jgi:hypothetical protein
VHQLRPKRRERRELSSHARTYTLYRALIRETRCPVRPEENFSLKKGMAWIDPIREPSYPLAHEQQKAMKMK